MVYLIENLQSLNELFNDTSIKNSIRKIEIRVTGLERSPLEQKLNRHYFACGCKEGAVSIYTALLIFVILQYGIGIQLITSWTMGIVVLFSAALAGKLIGLFISKFKLKMIYKEIKSYLSYNHRTEIW
jgi:hypothetical protein